MTSSCILGSVWLKIVENPNFFVFNPICLKFGTGGNFEMLITKSNPKLRLENDSAQQREEPACGRIPPPPACLGLNYVTARVFSLYYISEHLFSSKNVLDNS